MTPPPKHLRMTEAELQKSVETLLTLCGWKFHHETDSRKSRAGFPDLIAVHPGGRLLLIELKGHDARGRLGKVTDQQHQWLDVWQQAGLKHDGDKIASYVWTPEHWHNGTIREELTVRRQGANEIYAQKMSR